jgi:hypothetical protein
MPVRLQDTTDTRLLDADRAVAWVGQEGHRFMSEESTRGILPMFLANWDQTYNSTESSSFLSHLTMYVRQVELLRGIRDLGETILRGFPVQAYCYVGIGRSPAPLMAYFENIRVRAQTIPLSSFRPRNATWSITDDALITNSPKGRVGQPRMTLNQQQGLFSHFERYYPDRPPRQKVLLIDYTQTAQSLVAAQEQLQLFFQGRPGTSDIEVHALALCRDSDAPNVRGVGMSVGTTRNPMWHPVDWLSYSAQRGQFKERWHVLPIAELGQAQTRRQELVMRALSGQAFDDLAEYGSFKFLESPTAQPTRYTNNPNEPAAYDVLRDELRNV